MLAKRLLVLFVAVVCCHSLAHGSFISPRTVSREMRMARFSPVKKDIAQINCTGFGYFCNGCKDTVFCMGENMVPDFEDACPAGATCNPATGECSNATVAEACDDRVTMYKPICTALGLYPHPFECRKYLICHKDKEEAIVEECPANSAFDPTTMFCSVNLLTKNCTSPLKPCSGSVIGPVPGNTRLYFICKKDQQDQPDKYFPRIQHCMGNSKFVENKCVSPNANEGIANNKCLAKRFYFTANCNQYNECTAANATAYLRTCTPGNYFDTTKRLCTPYDCSKINNC